jgi:hypothetical protein
MREVEGREETVLTEAAVLEYDMMQTPARSKAPESKWKEMQNIGLAQEDTSSFF